MACGHVLDQPCCPNGRCFTSDDSICSDGLCQPKTPHVCAGKAAPSPCFPRDAAACGTSGTGRTCHCGTDIEGKLACYDVTFCNNPNPEVEGACASNADCVARTGQPGSVCFSAENCCGGLPGVPATGCAPPCPFPSA